MLEAPICVGSISSRVGSAVAHKTLEIQCRALCISHAHDGENKRSTSIPFFSTHPPFSIAVFPGNFELRKLGQKPPVINHFTFTYFNFRAYLKDAEEESSAELHRLTQTLVAYESVGMGFDGLVQQYTALMAEIDNKKWALSELRQNQDNELDDLWNQRSVSGQQSNN